jgi:hypothetical protein
MPIKANNIVVKSKEEPKKAPPKPIEPAPSSIKAKNVVIKNAPKETVIEKPKPVKVEQPKEKYVTKEEGELITKLNSKSPYMRDIFDLDLK